MAHNREEVKLDCRVKPLVVKVAHFLIFEGNKVSSQ